MTYAEAIHYLSGLQMFGAHLGLETTRRLAERSGNPQEKLRFIHVAGTNGKGSTCAMLEGIYRAAGLRVGLFTSPHLVSFRERVQVDRRLISQDDVARLVAKLRPYAAGGQPTTFFEFVTVLALDYFAGQKCDLVIWETGLGGRLDATNIVTPLASVITNIALDHQQWLGDTLAKITAEKAGIIKPGVPVITAADQPEVLQVVEGIARANQSPLMHSHATRSAQSVSLVGEHQRTNAALAIATTEVLQKQIPVTDEQVRTGLAGVRWPGRLQRIQRPSGQTILLDGAHNVAGVETLCAALKTPECSRPGAPTLILGMLADKDWRMMCRLLAPLAGKILVVPVKSGRAVSPAELAAGCRAGNPAAETIHCDSLPDALARAAQAPFVVIAGSLYLVGEALALLDPDFRNAGDERGLNEWGGARSPALSGQPTR